MLGWRGHKGALTAERTQGWEDGRERAAMTGKITYNKLFENALRTLRTLLSDNTVGVAGYT